MDFVYTGEPVFQSLNNAAATGVGSVIAFRAVRSNFGLQVVLGSGAPATAVVKLEGSNDYNAANPSAAHWYTLLTWDVTTPQTSGDILFVTGKPVMAVRANCTTLTTGANKTVSAWIGAAA
jgi:hypothetical protein